MTAELGLRGAAMNEADASPQARLCVRVAALLQFKLENPNYHRLMAEEMAKSDDPQSRKVFENVASTAIDRYRAYMGEYQGGEGLRAVDPAFLYLSIVGMCDYFVSAAPWLADQWDGRSLDTVAQDYAAFMCDLLLNGLSIKTG